MLPHPKNARIDCSNQSALSTREYIIEKLTSELQGICNCVIDDRVVTPAEAQLILSWLEKNHALLHNPITTKLISTLEEALADKEIDEQELEFLLNLLDQITKTGLSARIEDVAGCIEYDSLPHDMTVQSLAGVQICITGTLLCNGRDDVLKYLRENDVDAVTDVTQKTRYLVVGALGNKGWPVKNMSKLSRVLRERTTPSSKLYGCKVISENALLTLFPDMPFQFERVVSVDNKKNAEKSTSEVKLSLFGLEQAS